MSEVSNEAVEVVREIVEMRELHRNLIVNELGRGAANALKLLDVLYQRPIFSVADVADILGVSPQAANSLTDRLHSMGLVQEMTGHKRNRRFRYAPYIDIFAS